ncbi:hypothetical protein AAG906_036976 [Vitis piasezkii]
MLPGVSKVVRSVMEGVTRSPTRVLPHGQSRGGTREQTRGRRSYSAHCLSMSVRGGVAYTSVVGKDEKGGWTREGIGSFRVSNDISIRLMDGGSMPTENEFFNVVTFNKEQFNVGLRFSLPLFFK